MGRIIRGAAIVLALVTLFGIELSIARAADETGGMAPEQLRRAIGLAGSNDDESNIVFRLGVAFDLRGKSSDGPRELMGARLAAAQIAAAGGPKIVLIVQDIGTTGAWQGAAAEKDLHLAGVPLALVEGAAAGGTMLPGLQTDRILAFDGDVGVPGSARGQAYLWGLRANAPDDDFPVGLQYLVAAYPKTRRVALVYPRGAAADQLAPKAFLSAVADDGLTLASAIAVRPDGVDVVPLLAALKEARPEAVYVDRADPVGVLRAVHDAGLNVPVIGSTEPAHVSDQLDGYIIADDWFDAADPGNEWARLFVASYQARFGMDPDSAAANGYEDTFAVWTLIRRVLARGGDINSGERLQQEVAANPSFKSLYGGDGTELDEIRLDPKTHAVLERPFAVYRISDQGKGRERLATADMGGANFKLDFP